MESLVQLKSQLRFIMNPILLIEREEWRAKWNEQELAILKRSGRAFCLTFSLLYALHFFAIDIPVRKVPLELWARFRFSVAGVALLSFLLSYVRFANSAGRLRTVLFPGICFIVFMQALSMTWRKETPFFYVPLLACLGAYSLRLSMKGSLIVYGIILAVAHNAFTSRPGEGYHMVSASIVGAAILVVWRARMIADVESFILAREHQSTQQRLADLASRVAHDIRAPLGALRLIRNEIQTLDAEVKEIYEVSMRRIDRVVADILNERRLTHSTSLSRESTAIDIQRCIAGLVKEKSLYFKSHSELRIELNTLPASFTCHVNQGELERAVANLIDNSAEAMSYSGVVRLNFENVVDGKLKLVISDTGSGIPPDVLPKLLRVGGSYGKHNGNGIGLFHAKATIESWAGELTIKSNLGCGTTIEITLPVANSCL